MVRHDVVASPSPAPSFASDVPATMLTLTYAAWLRVQIETREVDDAEPSNDGAYRRVRLERRRPDAA